MRYKLRKIKYLIEELEILEDEARDMNSAWNSVLILERGCDDQQIY